MPARWIDEKPDGGLADEKFRESARSRLPFVRTDRSWRGTDLKKKSLFWDNGIRKGVSRDTRIALPREFDCKHDVDI